MFQVNLLVLRARLLDIIIPSRQYVRRMQAEQAAHWVRQQLEGGLKFRGVSLGCQLDWFEASLTRIIYSKLLEDDFCNITNPRIYSPTDLYRRALIDAGMVIDEHISIALPEDHLRIADLSVKAYGASSVSAPARIYCAYA